MFFIRLLDMNTNTRRVFMKTCVVGSGATVMGARLLRPFGELAADEPAIDWIQYRSEIDPIVKLIRRTPREKCVEVFSDRFKKGLTYQSFLAALFLTASETGDLHQLAQVNGAYRLSLRVNEKESLLPLFWVLDRIKKGQDAEDKTYFLSKFRGVLPDPMTARSSFIEAAKKGDKSQAEAAIISLSKQEGEHRAFSLIWEYAVKDLGGTLGHLPIGVANGWRTLQIIGLQHAEPFLRYMGREVCRKNPDETYSANDHRCNRFLDQLPSDWASNTGHRAVTLELYQTLRSGDAESAGDFMVQTLTQGKAKAGALWDAISLGAADLIYRYETGGSVIGGMLIHAITATNALRFGFRSGVSNRLRMMQLLQAAGFVANAFIGNAIKDQKLRNMDLVKDLESLNVSADKDIGNVEDLFATLPFKSGEYNETGSMERQQSDEACKKAFKFLRNSSNEQAFLQTARSLVCAKATQDPHDIKFPTAAFEDAFLVSTEWKPYLLASSMHALHGSKSLDAPVFLQARSIL